MLKIYSVAVWWGPDRSGHCTWFSIKAESVSHARRLIKKVSEYRAAYKIDITYCGPKFVSKGLNIIELPMEKHVATAVSHSAKSRLLKRLNRRD